MPFNVREDMHTVDGALDRDRLHAEIRGGGKGALHIETAVEVRQLPHRGEQPARRAAADGDLAVAFEEKDRARFHPARALFPFDGERVHAILALCRADVRKRADAAFRAARRADRRAKLHQALREVAAVPGGVDGRKVGGDLLLGLGPVDRRIAPGHARNDAQHVAVHGGGGVFKADRADRARRVVADARKRADICGVTRKNAAVPLDDLPRRLLQVARAAVVAEPLPQLEQLVLGRVGQRADVGQRFEKPLVVADDRLDAGLLEHDLRHPHMIGFAVAPPRQIPLRRGKPRHKPRGQRGKSIFVHVGTSVSTCVYLTTMLPALQLEIRFACRNYFRTDTKKD